RSKRDWSSDVCSSDLTATAPAGAGAPLARQTVTVSVTGTYDQTQGLLENLEHMARAYLLTTVSVTGDPLTGVYTTSITGDMFVRSEERRVGREDQYAG